MSTKNKSHMAMMRAKAQENKNKANPASEVKEAITEWMTVDENEISDELIATVAPVAPVAPPEERKAWKLQTMMDWCSLPAIQLSYALYYAKIEIARAIHTKRVIEYFIFHEGNKIETIYAPLSDEDSFA